MYNTETATEVATYRNGRSYSDFLYVEETLYRKKTGEFFLLGCGGPLTKYSRSCGSNARTGINIIIPFSEDEVKEWLVDNSYVDLYIEFFGEVEE